MIFHRRDFLKSIGVLGGGSLLSCNAMAPQEQLAAYLTPPVEMVPGAAAYYATVCRACPAGCGMVAKTRENRPIKLEGNPLHPVNRGKLCSRGQAFIQGLYSPQRVSKPLLRRKGKQAPVSWKTAQREVVQRLASAQSIGVLTAQESGTFQTLMAELGRLFGAVEHVTLDLPSRAPLAQACQQLFGRLEIPRIDLSQVDQIVALGADFLDAWVSPVELSRQWAEAHSFSNGRRMQLDYLGPRRNLTASAADHFHLISQQQVAPLALALLYALFEAKRSSLPPTQGQLLSSRIQQLGPRPREAGLDPLTLATMVQRLNQARMGLVLFGGAEVADRNSTATHAATLLINVLTGAVGRALRFGTNYSRSCADPEGDTEKLLAAAADKHDVLFIYGANPAYTLAGGFKVVEQLNKAKYVVALAAEANETTALAHAVLPVHHPLESWGDYWVSDEVGGLMQPVRAPLYSTRHVGDLLLELARSAGKKPAHQTYKDYLVAYWTEQLAPKFQAHAAVSGLKGHGPASSAVSSAPSAPSAPSVRADSAMIPALTSATSQPTSKGGRPEMDSGSWTRLLIAGGYFETPAPAAPPGLVPGQPLTGFNFNRAAQDDSLALIVPFSGSLFDGRGATQDWLREVPDSVLQTAWEIPVEVPPEVAQKKLIQDGDLVELSSKQGKVTARAIITEGLASGSVALRPGGGRPLAEAYQGTGNVFMLLDRELDAVSGGLALAGTRVTLRKIARETLVSVQGSPYSEGRFLALSMSLADAKAGKFPVMTLHGEQYPEKHGKIHGKPVLMPHQEQGGTRPPDNMYELQKHPEHRWGMVVDLDRCIGCGACSTACYAENNIPVVGRDEVGRGRELSWIRIEKHLFGAGEHQRLQFLPVMCQQCDNAPCETVCPVFASYHTKDGLNGQVYNRCIGTRYCSNNCPYKARRFNYFDYPRVKPAIEQLNPDVTVRSRGVMEKCTFCIQRIREVQNRVKVSGEKLQDGAILPACVQTCPTSALSFGDFKQPGWIMTQLARDPRGYRLLDYMVNTRPGVVYLRKVLTEESRS